MSYSFSVQGKDKAEAKSKAVAAFAGIVQAQPIHKNDEDAAMAAVTSFVDLLDEPEDGDVVHVSVNGYLSWHGDQSNAEFTGASVAVNASLRKA